MLSLRLLAVALVVLPLGCHEKAAPAPAPLDPAPAPLDPTPASTSTIDPVLQAAAEAELSALAEDPATLEASVVAIDPRTGELRAIAGRAGRVSAPELPARTVYVSGSVAKVFSVAAALDAEVVRGDERFSGADVVVDGMTIEGARERPTVTTEDVLVLSSNVGSIRIYERLGKARLHDALARFGFGERPPLEGATTGELGDAASWSERDAAKIAFGAGLKATPLQYAAAFAAVAALGEWRPPTRVRAPTAPPRRAMTKPHAIELLRLMEGVVHREDGTGTRARVAGTRVSGKTGTATVDPGVSYASFVGAVPAASPELVVYVGVKTSAAGYSGGTIAAPVFAKIVERTRRP